MPHWSDVRVVINQLLHWASSFLFTYTQLCMGETSAINQISPLWLGRKWLIMHNPIHCFWDSLDLEVKHTITIIIIASCIGHDRCAILSEEKAKWDSPYGMQLQAIKVDCYTFRAIFWNITRKSTIVADVLKDEKRLQADNVTQWNSQLKTIGSLLAIEEGKLVEIKDAPKLTFHEQLILLNIIKILTPFEEASWFGSISWVCSSLY